MNVNPYGPYGPNPHDPRQGGTRRSSVPRAAIVTIIALTCVVALLTVWLIVDVRSGSSVSQATPSPTATGTVAPETSVPGDDDGKEDGDGNVTGLATGLDRMSWSDRAASELESMGVDPDGYLDADGKVTNQKKYRYDQADKYAEYAKAVNDMDSKYDAMSDQELFDLLPEKSNEGIDYLMAFITWVQDRQTALRFGDVRTTTDPDEPDRYYAAEIKALADMESKMKAGEPLGFTVEVVDADGKRRTVDTDATEFHDNPQAKQEARPDSPATDSIRETLSTKWEHAILSVPNDPVDGSFKQTGEKIITSVGLNYTYDFQSVYNYCYSEGRLSDSQTLAVYCAATPNVIYINADNLNLGVDQYSLPYYASAIRHELAHAMIHRICGTPRPPMGVDSEALTNSYTVLYFGGDFDQLQQNATEGGAPWYAMTEASHQAAKLVHDGQCSVEG